MNQESHKGAPNRYSEKRPLHCSAPTPLRSICHRPDLSLGQGHEKPRSTSYEALILWQRHSERCSLRVDVRRIMPEDVAVSKCAPSEP